MKKSLSFTKLFMIVGFVLYFFIIGGVSVVSAQFFPLQIELVPEQSSTPSPSVNPEPTITPTPSPSVSPTPQSSVPPTPVPTQSSEPISTPTSYSESITQTNDSSDSIGGMLEDAVSQVELFPASEEKVMSSQEVDEFKEPFFIQTPSKVISPIIPRSIIERIIPVGLYKEDGLHPIDGLILLILGVGFIISGISLLRADVFLPALSDIAQFLRHPFKRRWVNQF